MSTYDVFISYRAKTDKKTAETIFLALRVDQAKNTRVFWDNVELKLGNNFKEQFLDALKTCKICLPIISSEFVKEVKCSLKDGAVDNLLLEWDTIIELCATGSGQMIIPIFIQDGYKILDLETTGAAMKEVRAKDCKRTAKAIWDYFLQSQGKHINIDDPHQVRLLARDIQEILSSIPTPTSMNSLRRSFSLLSPRSPQMFDWIPIPRFNSYRARKLMFNLYETDDPENFIDCDDVLAQIDKCLDAFTICNVIGLGGSGKTFVANKYAFLMRKRGRIIGKITADCEANIIREYSEFLKKVFCVDKLPVESGKLRDYVKYSSRLKSKVFIILDNVKSFTHIAEFVMSKNPNVKYLITSRTFIMNPTLNKRFYSVEACVKYLKLEINRGFSSEQCKRIVDVTNGFPLRLKVAAKFLQDPTVNLEFYLLQVSAKKKEMGFEFDEEKSASDDIDDLYPEVSLSIDKLTQRASYAYWYLVALVDLEPDLIIEKYLKESCREFLLVDLNEETPVIANLRLTDEEFKISRYNALQLGIVEQAYSLSLPDFETVSAAAIRIHRCVQAEIRDRVAREPTVRKAVGEIAKLYDQRTKSYETLYEELRAGRENDVMVLLQKWSSCDIDADVLEISHLQFLSKILSRNTSIKSLSYTYLKDKPLKFIESLSTSKIEELDIFARHERKH
ncbi:hypothetical protein HK098_003025 [Nowakowskiella sp. JEL0407]|nr:hypothetical protein HK098_003025 [Nowakowskiella sp. JEL0407]